MPARRKLEHEKTGHSSGKRDEHIKVRVVEDKKTAFEPMAANDAWDPFVIRWYNSIAQSAYSDLYQPSDWMTAYLIALFINQNLHKMSAAALEKIMAGMDQLLITEGSRRKARVEVVAPGSGPVDQLAEHRKKMNDAKRSLGIVA